MLERLLEPENRRSRMADLWSRVRTAGFSGPNRLNARPRNVDISAESFDELLRGRADLQVAPPIDLELSIEMLSKTSGVTCHEQHLRAKSSYDVTPGARTDSATCAAFPERLT